VIDPLNLVLQAGARPGILGYHVPRVARQPVIDALAKAEASGHPHTRQATSRDTMPERAAANPPHCCEGDRQFYWVVSWRHLS